MLFRSVNDQRETLDEAFAVESASLDLVCECGDAACVEQLPISSPAYTRIRSDPTLHILVPGHENATVESVVEEAQSYLVVRKTPLQT